MCRHCAERFATRARGLCWCCSLTPDVRDQYAGSESVYAMRGYGQTAPTRLPRPTTALPGTPEKRAVLEQRARAGLMLWHPDDCKA